MEKKMELQETLIKRAQEIISLCKQEIRDLNEDELKEFDNIKEQLRSLGEEKPVEEPAPIEEPVNEEQPQEEEAPATEEPKIEEKPTEERTLSEETNKPINLNKRKMEVKYSLVKELRNAYETGKKINLAEVRAYTVNDEGEDVVQTDIYDIWEPLRAKNVLVQAGAKYISGIKNNVQIPLMSAVSVNWAAETGAASDGSGAFSSKSLSPKRLTAKYPVSLELLAQDSIGVENAIRADIAKALSAKLEATILGGAAGSTTQPAGMFYGATPVLIENFAGLTALEAGVETANVYGEMKYIMSPAAKGDFRAMAKSSKSTQLVMEAGQIDGTPVLATSHIADAKFIYGDFSNLVIATWDNVQLDVVRDVASVGNGVVTIVVNAFVDAAVIRPEAFAFGKTQA